MKRTEVVNNFSVSLIKYGLEGMFCWSHHW